MLIIVTAGAAFLSPGGMEAKGSEKLYWGSTLLIAAGAMGAFLSTDLFFFYAFHELALIPTFLMIGKLGHGEDRVDVAWRATLYLGLGSLVLLGGLLGVVFATGGTTFDIRSLQELAQSGAISVEAQRWLFPVVFLGFGVLVSLFPFHSWAAPAYAAAPTPVAMLHAGVLKKFGLYGLLRVAWPMLPEGVAMWENWVMVLLLGNVIYIGLITISQDRLDRMLGYSSVMHMGYVFLGLISFNALGISGAIVLLFAHGVSTALLFGLCGQMRQSYPTLDMRFIGGQGKQVPSLCFLYLLAAFAALGLPGFANFSSELLVFLGGFKNYEGGSFEWLQWTTVVALWGVVISAVYLLRSVRKLFHGENPGEENMRDLGVSTVVPAALLVAVLLAVGIRPSLLLDLIPDVVEGIVTHATTLTSS
ncbi:MAG: NADH-quinone oxidoreductase subunit M [Verrucomicrobiota bacterium]